MAAIASAPSALGLAAGQAGIATPTALIVAALLLAGVQPPTGNPAADNQTFYPGSMPDQNMNLVPCPAGTYKGYSGAYSCTKCAAGSITSSTGSEQCTACTSGTSNSDGTACVDGSGVTTLPLSTVPPPAPAPAIPQGDGSVNGSAIQAAASVTAPSFACYPDIGGATRCGVPVGYSTVSNRTGAVLLPRTYKDKAVPYMVLLHGSGFTGSMMIDTFVNTAAQYQYGVIAPDSQYDMYWLVPDNGSTWTHDFYHIQAVFEYVTTKMPGVVVDPQYVTIVGNSRAGYAAPAFASQSNLGINSAIIIHASALAAEMGPHRFPIYWSTAESDELYGPQVAVGDIKEFEEAAPGFNITYRVWQGSHTIRNYTELADWSIWWLNPSTRSAPAPPLGRRLNALA